MRKGGDKSSDFFSLVSGGGVKVFEEVSRFALLFPSRFVSAWPHESSVQGYYRPLPSTTERFSGGIALVLIDEGTHDIRSLTWNR